LSKTKWLQELTLGVLESKLDRIDRRDRQSSPREESVTSKVLRIRVQEQLNFRIGNIGLAILRDYEPNHTSTGLTLGHS
jgi:hypothetical protein